MMKAPDYTAVRTETNKNIRENCTQEAQLTQKNCASSDTVKYNLEMFV